MKILPLKNRKLIEISGNDRLEFLQDLITVDIYKLNPHDALWGGLLSPQGKALFNFFLYDLSEFLDNKSIFIDIHDLDSDYFIDYIKKYILRSDIQVKKNENFSITAIWDSAHQVKLENTYIIPDPRSENLGFRYITIKSNMQNFIKQYQDYVTDEDEYKNLRITYKVVDPSEDMNHMDYYWNEINPEYLNAIDFKKGCFVGQEVVARLKHKAELKRQVISVFVMGNPETPTPMETDIKEIGTLLCIDSFTGKGLAYVRLDRWQHAIETLRSVTAGTSIVMKAS